MQYVAQRAVPEVQSPVMRAWSVYTRAKSPPDLITPVQSPVMRAWSVYAVESKVRSYTLHAWKVQSPVMRAWSVYTPSHGR